ncbi:MAG: putative zinc-binding metallopeptidase [Actinomycetota bacterium]|nr:putative zinc-binding metallopeptidase [Actinomycetota bacterium]
MRRFSCEHCGQAAPFDAQRCDRCGRALGYLPSAVDVRTLAGDPSGTTFRAAGHEAGLWRCLNSAWGCNWLLEADGGNVWCRSCRLTRGRPDEADPVAVAAWSSAEADKRRLVHQLDAIGLPVEGRAPATPNGLAFDLVHLPGHPGVTGHLDGVVTLDLTETDDRHRDELRRALTERYRTVIGHLRHEIGHYYWSALVAGHPTIDEFRALFGDERSDYGRALERHYGTTSPDWDPGTHITSYAGVHPLEDWAESFAHYLLIEDADDTANAYGLSVEPDRVTPSTGRGLGPDPAATLRRWQRIVRATNAVGSAIGAPELYPYELRGVVIDKLVFVHRRVEVLRARPGGAPIVD